MIMKKEDDVIDVTEHDEFVRRMRSARRDYDNPCIYCVNICLSDKCDRYTEWEENLRNEGTKSRNRKRREPSGV